MNNILELGVALAIVAVVICLALLFSDKNDIEL